MLQLFLEIVSPKQQQKNNKNNNKNNNNTSNNNSDKRDKDKGSSTWPMKTINILVAWYIEHAGAVSFLPACEHPVA